MFHQFLYLTVSISLFLVAGCSDLELATVEGTITYKGSPVKGLEVTFEPENTETTGGMGYTDDKGHYALHFPGRRMGTPPGKYVVRIVGGEVADNPGASFRLPAKYNSQSELTATVEPGSNTVDFKLD